MATTNIKNSVLLKTSSANDVKCSGGNLPITGIANAIAKSGITSIYQLKYKAEVAQVVTVGDSSYTPVASTIYSVVVYDPLRTVNSAQEGPRTYSYTTPDTITDIGGSAALQREYIHGQLVTKINADTRNYVTAASLGSGNGFTITDDGGYWPVYSQDMSKVRGASVVYTIIDGNTGGGFQDDFAITTAAVYSQGVGAKLAQENPIVDFVYGNLISGVLSAPPLATDGTTATSGQNYDQFVINSLETVAAHNVTGQVCYQERITRVFVDNGTGTSTTNLAGFLAFERQIREHAADLYKADKNSWVDFFDSPTLFQAAGGAVPATTGETKVSTAYGQFVFNNIGTNTITTPVPGNTGLLIDMDLTATEGAEYTPSLLTLNGQEFVVGQQECSVIQKVVAADHTDATYMVGFRIKAAHAADFNNYTDLGAIGFIADDVYTWGILNNAATVATDTTATPTDAAVEEYIVKVDIDGNVTCSRNGVTYPVYSVGTTPLVFDAGDTIIPFFLSVNVGSGDPDVVVSQILATANKDLVS